MGGLSTVRRLAYTLRFKFEATRLGSRLRDRLDYELPDLEGR
jgi:hypothetical protein